MSATASARRAQPAVVQHGLVTCRQALTADDLAICHAIRHEVFVTEQEVFSGSDLDEHDGMAGVINLLGRHDGAPAGSVRLYAVDADNGLWLGDRLCVLPAHRVHGVGAPLVRCAVATAGALGGVRMAAHVQLPNVRFFEHLGWRADGATEIYAGLPHQPMLIDLLDPEEAARIERELATGTRH